MTCPQIGQCKGRSSHTKEDVKTCPCGGAIEYVYDPDHDEVARDIHCDLIGPETMDLLDRGWK